MMDEHGQAADHEPDDAEQGEGRREDGGSEGRVTGVPAGDTLAEGIAVKTVGTQTLPVVKALVSDIVLVGEDPASQVYVRNKAKQTVETGMHSVEHRLDAGTSQETLLALIAGLNADDTIDGILVQLPLPPQIRPDRVIAAIGAVDDDTTAELLAISERLRAMSIDPDETRRYLLGGTALATPSPKSQA